MEENREINLAIAELRNRNQIVSKEFLGLLGTTVNGQSVWFPDSFQRGYMYELTPLNERPIIQWQIAGICALFSDGHFNYLPSFNQGRDIAKELKMYVLANQTKKITEQNKKIVEKNKEFEHTINDLKSRLEKLEKDPKKD